MQTGIEAAPWWPDLLAVRDELPVSALAARFGTTAVAIVLAFKRQRIAKTAQAPQGRSFGVAQAPRPLAKVAAAAAPDVAWEVRFRGDDRPRMLLAADFSSALGLAMRRGDVASVALLGPAL